jgi:three-Cys-motif partner protein
VGFVGSMAEVDPIGAWTKDKLGLLGKYICAYSRIMNSQKDEGKGWLKSYTYIDAFACTGRFVDESGAEVDGSPIVALRVDPKFDEFWFVERDEDRLSALKARVGDRFPGRTILYKHGDANDVLCNQIAPSFRRSSEQRGFIFLDPYGLQVDFETVESLGRVGSFDILLNLSTMGVQRLLPRDKSPEPWALAHLRRAMGDQRWVESLYEKREDLFGDDRYSRPTLSPRSVAESYVERLRPLFPFSSRPVEMRNEQGHTMYALILLSRNRKAVAIFDEITDKDARSVPTQLRLM